MKNLTLTQSIEFKPSTTDNDSFDVLIGVSIGIIILFILICGFHNCCCKKSSITENSTRNKSLSDNYPVKIEEDSNSRSKVSYPEGSYQ